MWQILLKTAIAGTLAKAASDLYDYGKECLTDIPSGDSTPNRENIRRTLTKKEKETVKTMYNYWKKGELPFIKTKDELVTWFNNQFNVNKTYSTYYRIFRNKDD